MIARTGLSARRSTRSIMSRSSVSSTPVSAPSTSIAFSSSSLTARRSSPAGPKARSTSAVAWPSSQTTGAGDRRQHGQRPGEITASALRVAQRQLLGHQLAEHQGQEGDDQHGKHQRQPARHRGPDTATRASGPASWSRKLRAAEHAGQDADQGDAELRGRQESSAGRPPAPAPAPRRARRGAPSASAWPGGRRPAPARSERKRAVQQDQDGEDEQLQAREAWPLVAGFSGTNNTWLAGARFS